MYLRIFYLFSFSFILAGTLQAQTLPRYRSPLDIPLYPSGTFGELRYNHFHSGIDLKTQHRQGLKVRAVGDGYVSRIRITEGSYGKAIYIFHPEGYTSVYGHLRDFSPKIDAYVRAQQYKKETYEVNLILPRNTIKVKKGKIIANSGNTGSSYAPHLHFEIRKTIGQIPMNPMLFGIKVEDSVSPVISRLFVYPLSDASYANKSGSRSQINFSLQPDGRLKADTIFAFGEIGLGIETFDRQSGSRNKNGIYSLTIQVNGRKVLGYTFKEFDFKQSIYINTLIDYGHYIRQKERIQKCFITSANQLKIYSRRLRNGIIKVHSGMSYNVKIIVRDFLGNKKELIIPIIGKKLKSVTPKQKPKGKLVVASRDNYFDLNTVKVYFPPNTFFEDSFINIHYQDSIAYIHKNTLPLKGKYNLSFEVSKYPEEIRDKLYVVGESEDELIYQSSKLKGNMLLCKLQELGKFWIAKDTIPPRVEALNFMPDAPLTNQKKILLHIDDNQSGIDSYRATINDHWILMEYESKDKQLSYNINDISFDRDTLKLSVRVRDHVGNITHYHTTLFKP